MKLRLLLLGCVAAGLYSCSSTYRSTQTPDDVYYSPAREIRATTEDQYEDYTSNDDRYLRMKAHNYNRWATLDDYSYWYDSRYYNNYYAYQGYGFYPTPGLGYYYSPYSSWYYPYCTVVYYKNPTVYFGSNSKSYLTAYRNNNYGNTNVLTPLQNSKNNTTNSFTLTQNNNTTRPARTFSGGSSNRAGGSSGGFKSTGSSTSTPRPPRPGGGN